MIKEPPRPPFEERLAFLEQLAEEAGFDNEEDMWTNYGSLPEEKQREYDEKAWAAGAL